MREAAARAALVAASAADAPPMAWSGGATSHHHSRPFWRMDALRAWARLAFRRFREAEPESAEVSRGASGETDAEAPPPYPPAVLCLATCLTSKATGAAMWSKGPMRKIEIEQPVGSLYGGRRSYAISGDSPRFVYPMATSGGGMLPKIPNMIIPKDACGPMPSPRMRSSEAYGAFYYSAPAPVVKRSPFGGPMDSLGAVDLQAESMKAAAAKKAEAEDRRWRGGPRFEPTYEEQLQTMSPKRSGAGGMGLGDSM